MDNRRPFRLYEVLPGFDECWPFRAYVRARHAREAKELVKSKLQQERQDINAGEIYECKPTLFVIPTCFLATVTFEDDSGLAPIIYEVQADDDQDAEIMIRNLPFLWGVKSVEVKEDKEYRTKRGIWQRRIEVI